MALRLKSKNNSVWGEMVNFYLPSGPICVVFGKKGEATINDSPNISKEIADYFRHIDPNGNTYALYDDSAQENSVVETMEEATGIEKPDDDKSEEEKILETAEAKDDISHGVDPLKKEAAEASAEKVNRERRKSGVAEKVQDAESRTKEERKRSGVNVESRSVARRVHGEGKGLHGIADVETDPKKREEEENARSGVDTQKRDAEKRLTVNDNESHGVAKDDVKSSARRRLDSEPVKDALRTPASKILQDDPRKKLGNNESELLYYDPTEEFTDTTEKEPKPPGE